MQGFFIYMNEELIEGLLSAMLESKKQECLKSFYSFLRYFWNVICPEKYEYNWHIKDLCNELQIVGERVINRESKLYDLCINIAPQETKSIIASQMFNAWLLTKDPTIRFLGTSHTASLSAFNAMQTKDLLLSEKYTEMFGAFELKYDMQGKGDFMSSEGGRRKASSVDSKVTGSHFHIKMLDDLVDADEEITPTTLKKVRTHIDKCWSRNVDAKISVNILIMQRVSENDPTDYFLQKTKGNVKHIKLPSSTEFEISPPEWIAKYKNGVLNNKRKPPEVLAKLKLETTESEYAAQYGQSPVSRKGKLIKRDMFIHMNKYELETDFFKSKIFILSDTAYTKDKKNDPSGFLIVSYYKNSLYLLDNFEVWLEAPEAIKFANDLYKRFNASAAYIENKASGMSIAQTLRTIYGINAIDYKQTISDKEARLINEIDFLDARRCVIVWSEDNKTRMEHFLHLVTNFPSALIHDEPIDTLTMGMRLSKTTKSNRSWN